MADRDRPRSPPFRTCASRKPRKKPTLQIIASSYFIYRESTWPRRKATAACRVGLEPAVWTDVGELMLLVFMQDGVPTWEVSRRAKRSSGDDLIANGAADPFRAAKAAARFEATAQSLS